jgi:outer membrane lipase/esterase
MLTDPADADFGLASLGLSATFAQRMQFYIFYEALLGASNLTGNSIAVGLRGQF